MLAVPGGHALAGRASVRLAEALDHPHVGLPPTTAVHSMLHREAAALGRSFNYRVVVSSFDAALRVVGAGLGVSVVPREVSAPHTLDGRVRLVPLNEPWAQRRFAICFRRREDLNVAAGRLVDHLCSQAAQTPGA
ncbi:Transcriptional regulator, LysR family [Hydrogenophaga intermedia]|uniref:Transcriptional regulator, LysR family n=1 Tax=Hydrogenophaga intermedia TaxID=65786 RepID=A0A1L1PR76_HYDIT|nr:Transcriptional regulator, LysR family [Hydrogenophaga intermedia]